MSNQIRRELRRVLGLNPATTTAGTLSGVVQGLEAAANRTVAIAVCAGHVGIYSFEVEQELDAESPIVLV